MKTFRFLGRLIKRVATGEDPMNALQEEVSDEQRRTLQDKAIPATVVEPAKEIPDDSEKQ